MLPLILSVSLAASPANFSLFGGGDSCKEVQEVQRKYYLSSLIGLTFLVGGVMAVQYDNKLGGGFAMGIGAPLATLGFLGMFEVYKW